jgi:hypothetical protein
MGIVFDVNNDKYVNGNMDDGVELINDLKYV